MPIETDREQVQQLMREGPRQSSSAMTLFRSSTPSPTAVAPSRRRPSAASRSSSMLLATSSPCDVGISTASPRGDAPATRRRVLRLDASKDVVTFAASL